MQSFESFMSTIFLRFYINGIGRHLVSYFGIFLVIFGGSDDLAYKKCISEVGRLDTKVNEWQMCFVSAVKHLLENEMEIVFPFNLTKNSLWASN